VHRDVDQGTASLNHLRQNMEAARITLDQNDMALLTRR
jgi:aryl-alcohol dehydrogenase-like predicted oxidoreductase